MNRRRLRRATFCEGCVFKFLQFTCFRGTHTDKLLTTLLLQYSAGGNVDVSTVSANQYISFNHSSNIGPEEPPEGPAERSSKQPTAPKHPWILQNRGVVWGLQHFAVHIQHFRSLN
jgi:hypothetical protein